ncbi:MAG TPA: hypothetical protein VIW24_18335 [Aldersonia sp.]
MRHKRLVPVAALALILTGCGGAGSTSESATTPPPTTAATTTTTTPTHEQTTSEPVPADNADKSAPAGTDTAVTVTDVRIGAHDGFDRVVYEFGGTGTPGWTAGYVDQAVQDGSGDLVEVGGTSILAVTITGAAYPFDSGVEEYDGPDPLTDPTATVVDEVRFGATFEGMTQSWIGTTTDRPAFTVTTLSNPTRLVVDIAT